ncbi:MAG: GNAT family N-acetyltransferase [Candidatus Omnitrophica bacterium]|nr:GNAT family N-acetyltransferase [Candidatus Omnitrophota bacterium]
MHIRRFRAQDNQKVKRFINSILKKEFPGLASVYSENDLKDIKRHYSGKREGFFVAIDNDKIIGTGGIKEDDKVENKALLRRIFIHPNYRRKGYGLKILDKAIEFCKAQGYSTIIFRSTSKMSAANNLVRKRGFVEREHLYFPLNKKEQVEIIKFVLNLNEATI